MEERKHIVILAAGDFPTHPVPLKALHEADFVVCCDSAYVELGVRSSEKPLVVIGDGDSLSPCTKHQLGDRYIQVDEQDYNDLHKAMDYATSRFTPHPSSSGDKRGCLFTILGATGKREDHTLGNISYLVTFAEEHPGADIEMLTDYGRFCAMRGCRTFTSHPGQQVSIFTMTPGIPFRGTGLRWPLMDFQARLWWQATLNEALGDSFMLSSEGWLVVFQTYDSKEKIS